MIKPNELRIGNYIQVPIGVKQIDGITGLGRIEIEDDDFDSGFYTIDYFDSECEPIPLTEEWLIRMGFKNEADNGYVKYLNDFPEGFHYLSIDNPSWVKENQCFSLEVNKSWHSLKSKDILFYDDSEMILTYIKYVHQLQNLYFALTGEELKINKD